MVEALMSPQEKTLALSPSHPITLKEQVLFQGGQEGLRVWESGIALARYFAIQAPDSVRGNTVVDLGSGTGIVGLSMLKYTMVGHVMFTDYQ